MWEIHHNSASYQTKIKSNCPSFVLKTSGRPPAGCHHRHHGAPRPPAWRAARAVPCPPPRPGPTACPRSGSAPGPGWLIIGVGLGLGVESVSDALMMTRAWGGGLSRQVWLHVEPRTTNPKQYTWRTLSARLMGGGGVLEGVVKHWARTMATRGCCCRRGAAAAAASCCWSRRRAIAPTTPWGFTAAPGLRAALLRLRDATAAAGGAWWPAVAAGLSMPLGSVMVQQPWVWCGGVVEKRGDESGVAAVEGGCGREG
jgi:hypothetical protein